MLHAGHDHGSHEEHRPGSAGHGSHAGHEAGGAPGGAGTPGGASEAGVPPDLLAGAVWDAVLLVLLAAVFGLWLLARRGDAPRRDALVFVAGLALVGLAAASPLVALVAAGSHLAYMVQLELLMSVSPVLLVLGLGTALGRGVLGRGVSRLAATPALGLGAWLLAMYVSHLPAVHGLVMGSAAAYAVQLLVFLIAGLAFWAPVLASEAWRPAARIRHLALAQAGAGVLAAVLIWYPAPIYDHAHGALPFGLSALADQRLSGVTMMVLDMLVAATVAAWIFVRELATSDRRVPPALE